MRRTLGLALAVLLCVQTASAAPLVIRSIERVVTGPTFVDVFRRPMGLAIDPSHGILAMQRLELVGEEGAVGQGDDRLRPLLKSLGLADRFEVIIVSCEIGASKPSPDPFHAALKAFNLPASEVLHVGDSAEMDLAGARAAGLHAAQIVRDDHHASGPGQIGSLCDLASLISRGHRQG